MIASRRTDDKDKFSSSVVFNVCYCMFNWLLCLVFFLYLGNCTCHTVRVRSYNVIKLIDLLTDLDERLDTRKVE